MKKIYLLAILAIGATTAMGQSKLDSRSSVLLHQYQMEKSMLKTTTSEPKMVTAIVQLSDENTAELEAKGMEILRQRGDLAIVRLPMDSVETVVESSALRSMQFERPVHMRLDAAHTTTGVDLVKKGSGLDRVYTGEGVIASCVDQGIDPNHINFRKEGTTESRVKRMYTVNNGRVTTYDTPSKISAFTSDDKNETHGTHVMGIVGGSYYSSSVPYAGVATGADLAMVGLKTSSDADILLGIETLIDYAKSQNKPLVVNLSLGSNNGPHDGTTETDKYYERLGKDAIICVAAGNEGDLTIAATHKFASADDEMKGLFGSAENPSRMVGSVEFWSDNSTPFTLKPVIVSTLTGNIVYELDEITSATGALVTKTYSSSRDANISKYLSGSFTISCDVEDFNDRYTAYVELSNVSPLRSSYALGYVITGTEGNTVRGYADAWGMEFMADVNGWDDDITADGTINTMACAHNVISVGAYSTKNVYKYINGSTQRQDGIVNDIAEFSSYGTLIDGRKLPHVCAPGHTVVSSISTPYAKTLAGGMSLDKVTMVVGRVQDNGQYYFWDAMSGTSMATPYVTGTVALWLEANPKLTFDDVVEIINETSTRDSYVESGDEVQWGAGKINAYEGLKKVIKDSYVDEVDAAKNLLVRDLGDGNFEVFVGCENAVAVEAFDLAGRKVATAASGTDTVVLNLGGQQAGVYVLSIEGQKSHYTKKIVVR